MTATHPQAHQFLGSAYANLGDFQASATHFRRFLELSPNATAADAVRNQLDEWSRLGVIAAASEARSYNPQTIQSNPCQSCPPGHSR